MVLSEWFLVGDAGAPHYEACALFHNASYHLTLRALRGAQVSRVRNRKGLSVGAFLVRERLALGEYSHLSFHLLLPV